MDGQSSGPSDDDGALSVRLDVHLDREPISGRLRAEGGVDEAFVGWLGFADALRRVYERQQRLDQEDAP